MIQLPSYLKITIFLLLLVIVTFVLIVAKSILMPLAFSVLISLLLFPLCKYLQSKGISWFFSIMLSQIFLLVIFSFFFVIVYYQISNIYGELSNIEKDIDDFINQAIYMLNRDYGFTLRYSDIKIENFVSMFSESGFQLINTTLSNVGDVLNFVLIVPIYTFLILLNYKTFLRFFYTVFDAEHHPAVKKTVYDVQTTSSNYLYGLFSVMVIVGALNSTGLLILGIEHAIFWGFLASVLTVIPYIGIFIGSLLPALFALIVHKSGWDALYVLILFNFVQFLEGNFITPKVVGSKVSINALTSILALVVGSMIWGISGMILAMPVVAITKAILNNMEELKPYAMLMGDDTSEDEEDIYVVLKNKLSALFRKKKTEEEDNQP